MIVHAELATAARSYLRAARLLNRKDSDSPDAAAYLCGYAVEIALKVRICLTLGWSGYPETGGEFRDFASFKTHNLGVLLRLSGREKQIKGKATLLTAWSVVRSWNPEQRYDRIGTRTAVDARDMTEAAKRLLGALL